jgi:hypothetical protein
LASELVIASAAKQSILRRIGRKEGLDCFVASLLAMTAEGSRRKTKRNAADHKIIA